MKHAFTIIPLTVEARGEIITNNLPEFRELVRDALANINRDLKSDEDFGQAELDVKALKAAEDAVREAAVQAFDERLKQMVAELNETAEEIRAPRLELEKLIAARKDEVKSELIAEAMEKLECAPRLRQSVYGKSVADALKGKRTLDSMRKALDMIVTIHNGNLNKNRASIASFIKTHGEDLVPDIEDLEVKSTDSVEAELRRRFEAKKATEERKRLEAEAAKAKAELAARINPHNLPAPPKIGSIPTGSKAAAPGDSNVVPFASQNLPQSTISEEEEWKQITSTVVAAFALIKEHRERLIHEPNKARIRSFGASVNAVWATLKEEVAS